MDNILFDNSTEPYSLEAEQAVLGCILIDSECLLKVVNILRAECFYIPQHKEIYSTIVSLDALSQKFDALIVLEELKKIAKEKKKNNTSTKSNLYIFYI